MDTTTIDLNLHLEIDQQAQRHHSQQTNKEEVHPEVDTTTPPLTISLHQLDLLHNLALEELNQLADHHIQEHRHHNVQQASVEFNQDKEDRHTREQVNQLDQDSQLKLVVQSLLDSLHHQPQLQEDSQDLSQLQLEALVDQDQRLVLHLESHRLFKMMPLKKEITQPFPEHQKSITQFSQKSQKLHSIAASNSIQV